MTYTFDLDKPLLDTLRDKDGQAQSHGQLNQSLANLFKMAQKQPPYVAFKFVDWAAELEKTGKISLDSGDYDLVRKFVEYHEQIGALLKVGLLREFDFQRVEIEKSLKSDESEQPE